MLLHDQKYRQRYSCTPFYFASRYRVKLLFRYMPKPALRYPETWLILLHQVHSRRAECQWQQPYQGILGYKFLLEQSRLNGRSYRHKPLQYEALVPYQVLLLILLVLLKTLHIYQL